MDYFNNYQNYNTLLKDVLKLKEIFAVQKQLTLKGEEEEFKMQQQLDENKIHLKLIPKVPEIF